MSKSIAAAVKRGYDGTVARVAGNLLSADFHHWLSVNEFRVEMAVATARAIVAETKRTEPSADVVPSESIPASVSTDRGGLVKGKGKTIAEHLAERDDQEHFDQ